jgi:lipid-binding SYLF domain-containing protein
VDRREGTFCAGIVRGGLKAQARQRAAARSLRNSQAALDELYFPKTTKAGFVVGGKHGDGALIKGGKTVGYYSTSGGSVGLQAGVQTYG